MTVTEAIAVAPKTGGSSARRWLVVAGGFVAIVALFLLLPVLRGVDPNSQDLLSRLSGPTSEHPLGTDEIGRDVLSRVLYGGQVTLGLSLAITLGAALIGILLGTLAAAFYRRIVDKAFLRVVDIFLAFPFMLVALTVAGAFPGISGLFFALLLFGWVDHAVVARNEIVRANGLLFVTAARGLGASPLRVYFRHVLPTAAPVLLVITLVRFAEMMLAIAGLSFLGIGIQPPSPEWGSMVNAGVPFIEQQPLLLLAPGLAIALSCFAASAVSARLGKWLDPTVELTRRRWRGLRRN